MFETALLPSSTQLSASTVSDGKLSNAAINVMPNPPQVGVGRGSVGGLTQNLGPRGRNFASD